MAKWAPTVCFNHLSWTSVMVTGNLGLQLAWSSSIHANIGKWIPIWWHLSSCEDYAPQSQGHTGPGAALVPASSSRPHCFNHKSGSQGHVLGALAPFCLLPPLESIPSILIPHHFSIKYTETLRVSTQTPTTGFYKDIELLLFLFSISRHPSPYWSTSYF